MNTPLGSMAVIKETPYYREYWAQDPDKKYDFLVQDLFFPHPEVLAAAGAARPTGGNLTSDQLNATQSPEFVTFAREMQTLVKLRHAILPRIVEYGVVDGMGRVILALPPPAAAETLRQKMTREPRALSEMAVTNMAEALAEGLVSLQTQAPDFVLGEMHPDNLLLLSGGRQIVLKSFGAARFFPRAIRLALIQEAAEFVPPERARGGQEGRYTDVYMLAGVLYYMLTKLPPQREGGQLKGVQTISPGTSELMSGVVYNCLQENVERRPPDARAMRDALAGRIELKERENPPILQVSVDRIDCGSVIQGAQASGRFSIRNVGGGVFAGTIQCPYPWISVTPSEFKGDEEIRWWADSSRLLAGMSHEAGVRIMVTNGQAVELKATIKVLANPMRSMMNLISTLLFFALPAGAIYLWYRLDPVGFQQFINIK